MKRKLSFILNIIIFILTIIASIIMFTGFKFMHGVEPVLESSKIGMFRFFTVDSNLFMGITAIVFAIYERKNKDIPKWLYILKLMATSGVFLTFVTVFAYLGPISKDGIISMIQNSNLLFHLLIPLLSMITFILFENSRKLVLKDSLYSIVPTALYGLFYTINILIHMEDGKVDFKYDWYWFVQNGVWTAFIVVPIILLISYLIGFILWKLNHRK